MKDQEIYILGLIGLRALAEFDPPEYRRSTDLSIGDLEYRIESFLEDHVDTFECRDLYKKLMSARKISKTPLELTFFLQQIYSASIGKAQYHSLQRTRQRATERRAESVDEHRVSDARAMEERGASENDELIRLSAMQMLRHLRDYSYTFRRRLGDIEIDCVLEPSSSALSLVLIKAHPVLRSHAQFEQLISLLKRAMSLIGLRVVGVIITEMYLVEVDRGLLEDRMFLLRFNVQRNEFEGPGFGELLEALAEPYLSNNLIKSGEE